VTFWVRATDSGGVAGEGTHERVVIDVQRFLQRVGALK
jgi:predicted thioesterase